MWSFFLTQRSQRPHYSINVNRIFNGGIIAPACRSWQLKFLNCQHWLYILNPAAQKNEEHLTLEKHCASTHMYNRSHVCQSWLPVSVWAAPSTSSKWNMSVQETNWYRNPFTSGCMLNRTSLRESRASHTYVCVFKVCRKCSWFVFLHSLKPGRTGREKE